MATKRNSNIELLRIFAMIMIIAYHIYIHSEYTQLTDANQGAFEGSLESGLSFEYKAMLFPAVHNNVSSDIQFRISKYNEFHSDRVLRYNFFERFVEGLSYIRILNHYFLNI